jgi:hypothetical protein
MTENAHPAIVARQRRRHQIRVRIATGAVGLFIAIFSVIYAQMPASAKTTTTQKRVASATTTTDNTTTSTDSSTATSSSPTPMTTSQS